MRRCLYCYQPLNEGEKDYHARCAKRFFGQASAPELPYTRKDINQLAQVVVENRTTVTGVQAKLSMDLEHDANGRAQRLTIVGVMGRYILKPQTEEFECLPEMEDLTMHLAEIARIPTVPHALIRFKDGELNYITRRIDRTDDGRKLPMEDMCQLAGRLTEITCLCTTPPAVDLTTFLSVKTNTISLYVPDESVDLYKATPIWMGFNVKGISESSL